MKRLLLFCAFLILLLPSLFAQEKGDEKISGLFSGLSFERFAVMVEAQSSYRFYFKNEEVDSLQINVQAYENDLPQILNRIFKETDLIYSIDYKNRVFITKENPMDLALSPGYFLRGKKETVADDVGVEENKKET